MEIERETVVEAAVAAFGVGLFILAVVFVGSRFGSHEEVVRNGTEMVQTQFGEVGALALIVGMVAFIVVMGALGLLLTAHQESSTD